MSEKFDPAQIQRSRATFYTTLIGDFALIANATGGGTVGCKQWNMASARAEITQRIVFIGRIATNEIANMACRSRLVEHPLRCQISDFRGRLIKSRDATRQRILAIALKRAICLSIRGSFVYPIKQPIPIFATLNFLANGLVNLVIGCFQIYAQVLDPANEVRVRQSLNFVAVVEIGIKTIQRLDALSRRG